MEVTGLFSECWVKNALRKLIFFSMLRTSHLERATNPQHLIDHRQLHDHQETDLSWFSFWESFRKPVEICNYMKQIFIGEGESCARMYSWIYETGFSLPRSEKQESRNWGKEWNCASDFSVMQLLYSCEVA